MPADLNSAPLVTLGYRERGLRVENQQSHKSDPQLINARINVAAVAAAAAAVATLRYGCPRAKRDTFCFSFPRDHDYLLNGLASAPLDRVPSSQMEPDSGARGDKRIVGTYDSSHPPTSPQISAAGTNCIREMCENY